MVNYLININKADMNSDSNGFFLINCQRRRSGVGVNFASVLFFVICSYSILLHLFAIFIKLIRLIRELHFRVVMFSLK